jgi:hypothetical protein
MMRIGRREMLAGTIAAGGMVAHRAAQGADAYDWHALAQDVKANITICCAPTRRSSIMRATTCQRRATSSSGSGGDVSWRLIVTA